MIMSFDSSREPHAFVHGTMVFSYTGKPDLLQPSIQALSQVSGSSVDRDPEKKTVSVRTSKLENILNTGVWKLHGT